MQLDFLNVQISNILKSGVTMDKKFQEYKGLDLSQVNKDVLKEWESNNTFEQSLKNREGPLVCLFRRSPFGKRDARYSPRNG